MRKQLCASCLVIAVFVVLPARAFAAPLATHPTGVIYFGSLTSTNIGEVVLSNGLGNVSCSTAIMTGTVETNSTASGVKETVTGAKFGGTTGKTISGDEEPECTGTGFYSGGAGVTSKPPYCLEATEASDNVKMRGGKCTEASSKPKLALSVTTIFGTVTCLYETAGSSLSGTLKTDPEVATGSFKEQEFVKAAGSGGECPGTGKLNFVVTYETTFSLGNEDIYFSF